MPTLATLGPLLRGDDYFRPQWERSYSFSETVRRKRPIPVLMSPTAMQRSSRFLVRDLAETHPWYGSHNGATWSTVEHGMHFQMLSVPQHAIDSTSVALRNKIKDQNLNAAVSIAEFREVGPMFLGLAQDIIRGYRYVKRDLPWEVVKTIIGKKSKRTPLDKAVSARYLEFTFGVAPLMSDCLALGDESARRLTDGAIQRHSASWQDRDVYESSSLSPKVGGTLARQYLTTTFVSRQVSFRRIAYYRVRSDGLKRASALGFTNPASVLWELTPLSFVIDWAIPVGNWLSSMDALTGVDITAIADGTEYKYDGSTTISGGAKVGTSTLSMVNKTRTVGGSLSIGIPRYKPSTSLNAVLSGLALLSQFRKGI